MTTLASSNQASPHYRQYTAPRDDATALIEPGRERLLDWLRDPPFSCHGSRLEFCGKSLEIARRQARAEVVSKAVQYTQHYRDVAEEKFTQYDSATATQQPIILSGHQPELFHAGVWFKNFLLSHLAQQSNGVAINFLVDNDLCRSSTIRVPARDAVGGFVAKSVMFDSPRDSVPWEMRRLGSLDCWQRFPQAVRQEMLPELPDPLLDGIWPDAIDSVRRTDRPGLAIAEARHRLEQRIGLETLEVPLSCLVSTRAFARFSIQLLSELPRFQEVYNSQLELYREAHRIRSHAHPVPALDEEYGWLEAPWWIYRPEAPHRQRMWVRLMDDQLILSDRAGWQSVIEGRLDCDNASSQWLDLLADGICIRPRALLTTMYLRMMVSDLFIHGIGGGKYDQLTDAIVREFFEMELPPMAVATATLHLPLEEIELQDSQANSIAEIDNSRQEKLKHLWQLKYHADQMLEHTTSAEAQVLLARKQELLANIPPRGEKWEWHREMTAVNRRLSEITAGQQSATKQQLESLAVQERHQRLLQSREFSFCLFPLELIASLLQRMSAR